MAESVQDQDTKTFKTHWRVFAWSLADQTRPPSQVASIKSRRSRNFLSSLRSPQEGFTQSAAGKGELLSGFQRRFAGWLGSSSWLRRRSWPFETDGSIIRPDRAIRSPEPERTGLATFIKASDDKALRRRIMVALERDLTIHNSETLVTLQVLGTSAMTTARRFWPTQPETTGLPSAVLTMFTDNVPVGS